MKCLIFSDSHGDSYSMIRAMRSHPDAEVIFFLGDGLSDLDALNLVHDKMVLAVRGNCDFTGVFRGEQARKTESICLCGRRIVLTHGDLFGAKFGEGGLLKLACELSADIVLFGHTHEPTESFRYFTDAAGEERPVMLFNPGSLGSSRHSYGILTLTDTTFLFSHATL